MEGAKRIAKAIFVRYGVEDSYAYILPPERVANIDEEIDFIVAEAILKSIK